LQRQQLSNFLLIIGRGSKGDSKTDGFWKYSDPEEKKRDKTFDTGIGVLKLLDDTKLRDALEDVHNQLRDDNANIKRLDDTITFVSESLKKKIADTAEELTTNLKAYTDTGIETEHGINQEKFADIDE
jgi:hypothetical protein